MLQQNLRGLGVAAITPFKDGEVDYACLSSIIKRLKDEGVDFLVAMGSTGEANTLTEEEEHNILELFKELSSNTIPIVAGNFALTDTQQAIDKIKRFDLSGIDVLMISCPSYVKPSQEGIYQHFKRIAEASPIPIMIYNVPSRTSSNISSETVIRLTKLPNFIGIKEASGDLRKVSEIIDEKPDNFMVWSGDDELAITSLSLGGDGLISVLGNAFPRAYGEMIHAALENDYERAREWHFKFYHFQKLLYVEGNPVGIKALMDMMGFCDKSVRLPLLKLTDENFALLEKSLDRYLNELR